MCPIIPKDLAIQVYNHVYIYINIHHVHTVDVLYMHIFSIMIIQIYDFMCMCVCLMIACFFARKITLVWPIRRHSLAFGHRRTFCQVRGVTRGIR